MSEANYQKVYAGEETESLAIKDAFNQANIPFIEHNNIQSGLRSGFYGGTKGVEILVQKKDIERAKKIIESIFEQ